MTMLTNYTPILTLSSKMQSSLSMRELKNTFNFSDSLQAGRPKSRVSSPVKGQEIFFLFTASGSVLTHIQPLIQLVPETPGGKATVS
jgi:hypothetical protein